MHWYRRSSPLVVQVEFLGATGRTEVWARDTPSQPPTGPSNLEAVEKCTPVMLHDIASAEQPLSPHINPNFVSGRTTNNAKPTWAHDRVRPVQFPSPFHSDPALEERCELSQCWRTRRRQLSGWLDPLPVRGDGTRARALLEMWSTCTSAYRRKKAFPMVHPVSLKGG